jgi:hypothetical protein
MASQDASGALKILLKNPYLEFFSKKNISQIALSLSEHYKLGRRDGLIAANFIQTNWHSCTPMMRNL